MPLLFRGCVTAENPPDLGLRPVAKSSPAKQEKTDLAKLRDLLKKHPQYKDSVEDVLLVLEMKKNIDLGISDKKQIRDGWFNVVLLDDLIISRENFKNYIKAEIELFPAISLDELVDKLRAVAESSTTPPYMIANNLKKSKEIRSWLIENIKSFDSEKSIERSGDFDVELFHRLEENDKSLTELSNKLCDKGFRSSSAFVFDIWMDSLKISKKLYIEGVINYCRHEYDTAINLLLQSRKTLASVVPQPDFVINLSKYLMLSYKASSNRKMAAEEYLIYGSLWKNLRFDEGRSSYIRDEFDYHRLNQVIWAARYRALIGDYKSALGFLNDAERIFLEYKKRWSSISTKWQKKIKELQYEIFYVRATRVFVETDQLEQAQIEMLKGISEIISHDEWKMRFKWMAGFISYLKGDYNSAQAQWETFLSSTSERYEKSRALYWLSEVQRLLGNQVKERFYLKQLVAEDPLGYYSVAAIGENSQELGPSILDDMLKFSGEFSRRLSVIDGLDLSVWRKDSNISKLLKRTEILVAANIKEHAGQASGLLRKKVLSRYSLEKNFKRLLYLSRLEFGAGNFFNAIDLTHRLYEHSVDLFSDYPEQIVIKMPLVYLQEYEKASSETGVSMLDLLSISRQESSFRADVQSPADAVGLMQLIVPTARRYEASLETISGEQVMAQLKDPEKNVLVGARYLKSLYQRYSSAYLVYAAYNAGEYAVDRWRAARKFDQEPAFIEMIPYLETRNYVKKIKKNIVLYEALAKARVDMAYAPSLQPAATSSH